MIDHNLNDFKSEHELRKVKNETLAKISTTFKIPAKSIRVIWSGRGYHIELPIDSKSKILEKMPRFKKLTEEPSKDFLRFIEWYLSNGRCDVDHNSTVSLNNCLLRVPGTFNAKNDAQVKINQRGVAAATIKKKVKADLLYNKFEKYLIIKKREQELKSKFVVTNQQQQSNLAALSSSNSVFQKFFQLRNEAMKNKNGFIPWIEKFLKTAISQDRYFWVWKIHVPYLINVKHLSPDQTFES